MVSSTRQAIAGILVIFGVGVFARAQTTPVKEPTANVSGRVTIKDKGVPGIAIGLRPHDSSRITRVSHRAVTDTNGEYRITNVPAGTYYATIHAPGFVSQDEFSGDRPLIINKGETIEHVNFALVRGGVITGKVVDPDGQPLIEQDVALFHEKIGDRVGGYYPIFNVRTDDRGIYRAFGIPPGTYKVASGSGDDDSFVGSRYRASTYRRTYHPNVADQALAKIIEVSEGSETTNVDITLSRTVSTYSASGRILDEAGQPVANVSYGVTHFVNSSSTSSMSTGAVSNARGEFRLDKLVPGQYGVTARPEGNSDFRADQVRFEITDHDVTGLVITTKKAASVSGVVVLEGDDKAAREQLASTSVSISIPGQSDERFGFGHWARPSSDGSFRIGGLPAGTGTFYLSHGRSRFRILRVERDGVIQPRGIEIREREQVTGVRIVATYANASIRGTIEVQNGPLPPNARFVVWLRKLAEETGGMVSSDSSPQVDARGQFVIEGLMPGSYELHIGVHAVGVRGELPYKKQEIVVAAGAVTNVMVTLDLSTITTRP